MRAVDTNLVVRLIVRDETAQTAAAEEFINSGAWVSHLVLAETIWVLTSVYGLGRSQIAAAIEMLLDHQRLVIEDPGAVSAALAHYRKTNAPEFSDCLILEIARKNGHLPLGTFDRALSKLGGAERL
jgi:predicted nucleic-acid-binding protein